MIERGYTIVKEAIRGTEAKSDWRETSLDKLGRIVTGKTPSSRNAEYFGGHIQFVTPRDFNGRRRIESTERHLTKRGEQAVKAAQIPSGAVMVSCIGSDMGKSAITVEPCVTNQQINSLIVDSDNDPLFVYYNLSSRKDEIRASASGSAQPILNKSAFGQLPIIMPPLPEQRAIAYVLGTLDDKIELNRRMNETLEEMARALFKSWFVDFEPVRAKMEGRWRRGESLPRLPAELYDLFPGRLVGSEVGEVPEGWGARRLSSFGKIVTGKTPSTRNSTFYGTDVPFLRIPDMHGRMYAATTGSMLSNDGATSQSRQALPSGSISVSCIATPGLVILNHRKTHTNQQINSIVPNDMRASKYLYWWCRQIAFEIMTGGSGGSVFHNMNKSTFSAIEILDTDIRTISAFEEQVSPLHAMILSNEKQSQHLAAQRDALLPRLVSGDVSTNNGH